MTAPLYGGVILDRFRHPRHFGDLPGADAVHEDVNPLCGDRLRVELRLGVGRDIEAIRFQGDACAIATAAADLLAEMVEGRPAAEALGVERDRLMAALEAPIRASRLSRASAEKTLFYQLGVSAPLLLAASLAMGEAGVVALTPFALASLAYQGAIVAFASYLAWFWLLTRYLAGRLAVFSFMTPLFGVLAGVAVLGEPLRPAFAGAALLVGAGIVLVNRR